MIGWNDHLEWTACLIKHTYTNIENDYLKFILCPWIFRCRIHWELNQIWGSTIMISEHHWKRFKMYKRKLRLLGPLQTGATLADLIYKILSIPSATSTMKDVRDAVIEWITVVFLHGDSQNSSRVPSSCSVFPSLHPALSLPHHEAGPTPEQKGSLHHPAHQEPLGRLSLTGLTVRLLALSYLSSPTCALLAKCVVDDT